MKLIWSIAVETQNMFVQKTLSLAVSAYDPKIFKNWYVALTHLQSNLISLNIYLFDP